MGSILHNPMEIQFAIKTVIVILYEFPNKKIRDRYWQLLVVRPTLSLNAEHQAKKQQGPFLSVWD